MLAVDGTKMIMTCEVSLHNNLIAYVLEEIVKRDVTEIDYKQVVSGTGDGGIDQLGHGHDGILGLNVLFCRLDKEDDIIGLPPFVAID